MATQMRPIDPHLGFVGIYKESCGLIAAHPKKLLLLTAAFILPLVFVSTAVNQALKGTLDAEVTYWASTHQETNGSGVTVSEFASELAFTYFGGPFSSWPRYFLRPVFGEAEEKQVEVEHVLLARRRAAEGDYADYTSDGSETTPPPPADPSPSDYEGTNDAPPPPDVLDPDQIPPPPEFQDPDQIPPPPDFQDPDQIPPPPEFQDPDQIPPPPQFQDPDQTPPPPEFQDPDQTPPPPEFQDPEQTPPPPEFQDPEQTPPPPEFQDPDQIPPPPEFQDPDTFPPPPDLFPKPPAPSPDDVHLEGPGAATTTSLAGESPPPNVLPSPSPAPGVQGSPDDYGDGTAEDPQSDPFPESPPEGQGTTNEDGTNGDDSNGDGTNVDGSNGDGSTSGEPVDQSEPTSPGTSHLGLIIFLYICSFSLLIGLSLVSVVTITSAVAGIYGTKYGVGHIWQPMEFFFADILRSIPETALRVFGTGAVTMTVFFGSLAVILQIFKSSSSTALEIFLLVLYAVGAIYVTTIWSLAFPVVVLEKPMTWGFKPLIRSFHLLTAANRVWVALAINVSLFYGGLGINLLTSILVRAITGNSGFGWSLLYVILVSLVMTLVIFITILVHTVFFCICKARCDSDKDVLQNVKYVALSEKSSGLLEEGVMKPKTKSYEDELDDL